MLAAAGGPRRRRAGDRSPRRRAGSPARADRRPPATRALPGPAHRGPLPLRSPGRRARLRTATPAITSLDELGLDPGPELRALERAVLAQDPALDAPIVVASAVVVQSALPVALTSFVGRGRELTDVVHTLGRARLVTVVGPGGVGKSRLTLELAHRMASDREVWFIELAPLIDGAAVADADRRRDRCAGAGSRRWSGGADGDAAGDRAPGRPRRRRDPRQLRARRRRRRRGRRGDAAAAARTCGSWPPAASR